MRHDYRAASPEPVKALAGVNAALLRAGLKRRFMNLLFLRVSQIKRLFLLRRRARPRPAGGGRNQRAPRRPRRLARKPLFHRGRESRARMGRGVDPCRPHPRARRSLFAAGAVFRRQDDRQHHLCRRADERPEPHRHRLPSGACAAPQMMGHSGRRAAANPESSNCASTQLDFRKNLGSGLRPAPE
jgi:hypothetical protein